MFVCFFIRIRVTVESLVATGSGHSKKKAKHNAAKAALDKLLGLQSFPTTVRHDSLHGQEQTNGYIVVSEDPKRYSKFYIFRVPLF